MFSITIYSQNYHFIAINLIISVSRIGNTLNGFAQERVCRRSIQTLPVNQSIGGDGVRAPIVNYVALAVTKDRIANVRFSRKISVPTPSVDCSWEDQFYANATLFCFFPLFNSRF